MGNAFRRSNKKENEYMAKIKDFDVESDEISNELPINNIVLVKCLKEIIAEVEELQKIDKERIHMISPKLDCMNFSLI